MKFESALNHINSTSTKISFILNLRTFCFKCLLLHHYRRNLQHIILVQFKKKLKQISRKKILYLNSKSQNPLFKLRIVLKKYDPLKDTKQWRVFSIVEIYKLNWIIRRKVPLSSRKIESSFKTTDTTQPWNLWSARGVFFFFFLAKGRGKGESGVETKPGFADEEYWKSICKVS